MVDWSIGYGATALDFNQLAAIANGDYVVSGCTPSDGANAMEVDIASGTVRLDGSDISVSSQTVTLSASNTDPRKDIIYIDGTGSAIDVTGTAAPAEPSGDTHFDTYQPPPSDMSTTTGIIVAEVWVGGGVSDIASGDIRNRTHPSNFSHDHLSDVSGSDHHVRPSPGNQLSEDANNNFDVSEGAGSGLQADMHVTPNAHIPTSEIKDTDHAEIRVFVPAGQTIEVWSWGARTNSNTTPTGLTVELYDDAAGSSVFSENTPHNTGSPITSSSGGTGGKTHTLRLDNATGGSVKAGAKFGYTIS